MISQEILEAREKVRVGMKHLRESTQWQEQAALVTDEHYERQVVNGRRFIEDNGGITMVLCMAVACAPNDQLRAAVIDFFTDGELTPTMESVDSLPRNEQVLVFRLLRAALQPLMAR